VGISILNLLCRYEFIVWLSKVHLLTVCLLLLLPFPLWSLTVSGGPYGLEDAVGTGYPCTANMLILTPAKCNTPLNVVFFLVAMVTIPWFWSLPIALMTAELVRLGSITT